MVSVVCIVVTHFDCGQNNERTRFDVRTRDTFMTQQSQHFCQLISNLRFLRNDRGTSNIFSDFSSDIEKLQAVKNAFFRCHGPLLTQLGVKNVWKDFARAIEKKNGSILPLI